MHTNRKTLVLTTIAFTMVLLVNLKRKISHSIDKKSEEIMSKVILCCNYIKKECIE